MYLHYTLYWILNLESWIFTCSEKRTSCQSSRVIFILSTPQQKVHLIRIFCCPPISLMWIIFMFKPRSTKYWGTLLQWLVNDGNYNMIYIIYKNTMLSDMLIINRDGAGPRSSLYHIFFRTHKNFIKFTNLSSQCFCLPVPYKTLSRPIPNEKKYRFFYYCFWNSRMYVCMYVYISPFYN